MPGCAVASSYLATQATSCQAANPKDGISAIERTAEDSLSAFEHYLIKSYVYCKFVIHVIRYCVSVLEKYFLSAGVEKVIKYIIAQISRA